jgi:hypothetical protein
MTENHRQQMRPCIYAFAMLIASGLSRSFSDFIARQMSQ